MQLTESQHQALRYWLPGLVAGGLAWLAFVTLGDTPLIRASGLALVIVGMTMTLRRSGAALAITGGLALAFSPAFWSQASPSEDVNLLLTIVVLVAAGGVALLAIRLSKHWFLGLIIAFAFFSVLFWIQLASVGSLRMTTLTTAWLLFLLVDALYITNPHPDDPPAAHLEPRHTFGILILLAVGVINAPLFILLAPAVVLGLVLTRARLSWWYWALLALIVAVGVYGTVETYLNSSWWQYPAAQAEALGIRVPALMGDGWHEASRWIALVNLVVGQFTVIGVGLGILGLSRLSRWYPPLGTVTMIAYAMHALFGLLYFGNDGPVLLLPLLVVQIFWMTYAVYALGQWLQRSLQPGSHLARWLVPAAYVLLPALMLARITAAI